MKFRADVLVQQLDKQKNILGLFFLTTGLLFSGTGDTWYLDL